MPYGRMQATTSSIVMRVYPEMVYRPAGRRDGGVVLQALDTELEAILPFELDVRYRVSDLIPSAKIFAAPWMSLLPKKMTGQPIP